MSKTRTCKCGTEYEQYTSLQNKCIPCVVKDVKIKAERVQRRRAKDQRKDTRERRERLKTRSDHLADAQMACNAYIRERDKGLPCISCGNTRDVKYCAGHYKTKGGHPELRFHPMNINRQCDWNCNLNLSGNIGEYRPRLIEKIGLKAVEWLEGPHQAQNWSIEEIKEIKQWYKEQLKYLKVD